MSTAFPTNLRFLEEDDDDILDQMENEQRIESELARSTAKPINIPKKPSGMSPTDAVTQPSVEALKAPSISIPVTAKPVQKTPEVVPPATPETVEEPKDMFNPMMDEDAEEEEAAFSGPSKETTRTAAGKRTRLPARGEDRLKLHLENLTSSTRFRVTEADEKIFHFLSAVRYSPAEHLALILGVKKVTAAERANRLYRRGYLERRAIEGGSSVYFLSTVGRDLIDSGNRVVPSDFGLSHVSHTVQVNRLVATIQGGTTNELETLVGGPLAGAELLTEPNMKRIIAQRARERSGVIKGANVYRTLSSDKRVAYAQAKNSGSYPEQEEGMEWVFGVYDGDGKYHYPDLAIKLERPSENDGGCIAVEVELSVKSIPRYESILRFYKKEFEAGATYGWVYWVVKNEKIGRLIEEARKNIGLSEKRCQVILLDPNMGLDIDATESKRG